MERGAKSTRVGTTIVRLVPEQPLSTPSVSIPFSCCIPFMAANLSGHARAAEWAGKATHEWVMKTWLDHSDWPSDDELKAEVTALTITQRLGAFGSIEVRDQSIVGPVIVMTRADGIPTDRHPKKAEHDQKHLESLVHSAVEALHADAVLGWLLKYVITYKLHCLLLT